MLKRVLRFVMTFNGALWAIGIIAAIYVGSGPLVREALAHYTWQKTECFLAPDGRFFFEFKGHRYYCNRPNMWEGKDADAALAADDDPLPYGKSFCWVNGQYPPTAVLRLDAYQHLDDGWGHFAGAGMILAGVGIIAFAIRKKAR